MDRVSVSEAEGRGFDSRQARHTSRACKIVSPCSMVVWRQWCRDSVVYRALDLREASQGRPNLQTSIAKKRGRYE